MLIATKRRNSKNVVFMVRKEFPVPGESCLGCPSIRLVSVGCTQCSLTWEPVCYGIPLSEGVIIADA